MAKLYLDECVPVSLARLLTQHGHDVTTAMQRGLRQRNVPFHHKYAATQELLLITTNQSDFRLLHRFCITMHVWEVLVLPHPGIMSTAIRQLDDQAFTQAITDHLSEQGTVINTFWMWDPATGWH